MGRSKSGGATMGTVKKTAFDKNILEMSNQPRTIKGGRKRAMNDELEQVMEPAIINQNRSLGTQKEEGWYEGGEQSDISY